MKTWLRQNSLSVVLFALFALFITGQAVTGYVNYNSEQETHQTKQLSFPTYLHSGAFIEATFENWESEFLQMSAYVGLTIFLRQKGSAESKKLDEAEPSDKDPKYAKKRNTPWLVRRGGWILKVYENSLVIVLALIFLLSFALHAYGGARETSIDNLQHGEEPVSTIEYASTAKFWFESFQNWQSEFLAVFALVILSIYLRQKGSPESKPVDSPHNLTGNE